MQANNTQQQVNNQGGITEGGPGISQTTKNAW